MVRDELSQSIANYPTLHYFDDLDALLGELDDNHCQGMNYIITFGHVLAQAYTHTRDDINDFARIIIRIRKLMDARSKCDLIAVDAKSAWIAFGEGWNSLLISLERANIRYEEHRVRIGSINYGNSAKHVSLLSYMTTGGLAMLSPQLPFPDTEITDKLTNLVTPRHINHDLIGATGLQDVSAVPGLKFLEGFLTPEEQAYCIDRVDAADSQWRSDLSRRVQHYGWRYDYKARAITPDMHIGALPDWLAQLAQKLYDETGLFDCVPEQVIVNEYLPGQGIATHIDHPGFGPTVCTISLLDDWENGLFGTLEGQIPGPADTRVLRPADRFVPLHLAAWYCAAQDRGLSTTDGGTASAACR